MRQGEIWSANLNPVKGGEQVGFRPVLIVSGNLVNEYAPVVLCCPITSKLKFYKGNPILEPNDENGLKVKSEAMVIHLMSISKGRLKARLGKVSVSTVSEIKSTINDLLNL